MKGSFSVSPPQPTPNSGRGILLGLSSSAATGSAFIFSKFIQQHISTATFVVLWYGAASLIGLFGYGVTQVSKPSRLPRLPWRWLIAIALFSGVRGLAQHRAIALGDPALVAFLSRLTTIHVLIASVLVLKEQLTTVALGGAGLVIAGAALITHVDTSIDLQVLMLMVLATTAEAGDIITVRAAGHHTPRPLMVGVRGFGGMAAGLLLIAAVGPAESPAPGLLLILLAGAAISPFAGYLTRYEGLRHINAWLMGVLLAVQPLFTLLYAHFFLGHVPDGSALLGGLVLVAGVLLVVVRGPKLVTSEA